MNIDKYLHQTLLYWRKTGQTSAGPVYAQPVEVPCRWEDEQVELITSRGREVISNSHIITNADLEEGSYIFKGTLADWKKLPGYPKLPDFNQSGREVTMKKETPNRRNTKVLKEWFL